MLSRIFESAELSAKVAASIASGDWSGWTAGELDDLVTNSSSLHTGNNAAEDIDDLIGKIVRSGKEFPDNFWEALTRKYSPEELSGLG